MQDIYAFDVGDFGKLGLLRHLARSSRLRLGVLWWKTDLGSPGADGKHVGYLNDRSFRACDEELWDEMKRRFRPDQRRIADLHPLLPPDTVFHDALVPARMGRATWFDSALERVRPAEVVFCDPDNGLRLDTRRRGSRRHVDLDEVRSLFGAGHSLVLYHTPGRATAHHDQLAKLVRSLRAALPTAAAAHVLRFRRGTSRGFVVLAQQRHAGVIGEAVATIGASRWARDGHFEVLG